MFSSPDIWADFFNIYYKDEINRLAVEYESTNGTQPTLYVNVLKDLIYFKEMKLMEELFERPDIVIKHAEEGLKSVENIYDIQFDARVRFINLPRIRHITIRDLRLEHASRFISIEGIVRSVSEVTWKITVARFECDECGRITEVVQPSSPFSSIVKPKKCGACNRKKFTLLPEESERINMQRIYIQEFPENLRAGEQPGIINAVLDEDLIGTVYPGDRITVNGIVRAVYNRNVTPEVVYIEANSIEVQEREYEDVKITEEDREKILELGRDPEIYSKIVRSICPAVKGYDDIKLAIALQLFGGVPRSLPDGTRIRGDIHVLLVGDPGLSKSKLLNYVHHLAPRSVLVIGKGGSVAGLTVAVRRDEIDGSYIAEAGALVLADKGEAIVDELDKMDKEERSAMHSAMEDQVVTVNKAGLNMVLPTRCSLLAAANPKYGRFDRYSPLPEQIDLPPTLISRFDLIFILLDVPDEERDTEVADHILRKMYDVETIQPEIPPELLKKYIAYAKQKITDMKIEEQARKKLIDFYVKMRMANKEQEAIPITARQIEAMIRLAEASAKLRLSNVVTVEDAERAISLVKSSLKDVATDPETGEMDIDMVIGTPKSMRDKLLIVRDIIKDLDVTDRGAPEEEVIRQAVAAGIPEEKVRGIIQKLKQRGEIIQPRNGYLRVIADI